MKIRVETQQKNLQERLVRVSWEGRWHRQEPVVEVHLPGAVPILVEPGRNEATLLLTTEAGRGH